jgi:LacI family transcriptional regulator
MQQIADRSGVSKFSVSQALSGKPGVSEETRQIQSTQNASFWNRVLAGIIKGCTDCWWSHLIMSLAGKIGSLFSPLTPRWRMPAEKTNMLSQLIERQSG